jgi:hypothetical protein
MYAMHLPSRRQVLQGLLATGACGYLPAFATGTQATRGLIRPPRAKTVIQIWMWGGPSHLDTFDPKPEAGRDYCGPLDSPIETNISGIQISQLLPQLAKQADKYSILRSVTHGINGHETASYLMQTGQQPGRLVCPTVGAVIGKFKGYEAGYAGVVPPYVVLTKPQGRFSEAGFLGLSYKPFATGGDPNQTRFAVEGIVNQQISDDRQRQRRQLAKQLDTLGTTLPEAPPFEQFAQADHEAYELMFGEARALFDLSDEKEDLRKRYGRTTFGQSCLMARRLAEAGVPYITINYQGWDTHKQHFQTMQRKLPELDQGLATLLQDLSDRGLLDQTIVWWGGEFGRGPKIQFDAPWNGGRGHFGACFSHLVAGGGFRGGTVVGASDERGMSVAERPISPRDLISSIYQLMDIDPSAPLPNPRNLAVTVLPPSDDSIIGSGPLREIM